MKYIKKIFCKHDWQHRMVEVENNGAMHLPAKFTTMMPVCTKCGKVNTKDV